MQKGKFGFSLWLYPYIALWTLFVWENSAVLICLAIALFVMAIERNEWCIRQCLKTVMFSLYWGLYNIIMGLLTNLPYAGYGFLVVDFIITIVVFIIVFIFGMMRLVKGCDISIPGKGIVDKAYGIVDRYLPTEARQEEYKQPIYQQENQPTKGFTQPSANQDGFTSPKVSVSDTNTPSNPPYTPPEAPFAPPPAPKGGLSYGSS